VKCGSSMRAAYFSSEVQMTQFQISPNQFHRTYLTLLAQMKMLNSCIVRYHIRIVRKRNNRKPGAACGHAAYLANTLSRRLEKKKPSTSQSKRGILPCLISVNSSSWENVALIESVRTTLHEKMCARQGDGFHHSTLQTQQKMVLLAGATEPMLPWPWFN
jgi:hypothetical protein